MNIIIADDHPLFRSGVRNLIQATDDLVLIGDASTGKEAIHMAEVNQPDLILMDIHMPDMDGLEATRQIKSKYPNIHILILSLYKDDKSVSAAMKAGAGGYMLKEADGIELLQAIRMVGAGSAVFSPGIASRMASFFEERAAPVNPRLSELTGREKEVLRWLAEGDSNAQIALRLHLSVKTVANNVTNILNKLQVADRNEARLLVKSFEGKL
jgi:DNA-binding NarL/FixJ family response regulator